MHTYKYFLLLLIFFFYVDAPAEASAKEDPSIVGTVWQLNRNSSSSKFSGHGQVLYFFLAMLIRLITPESFHIGILFLLWILET